MTLPNIQELIYQRLKDEILALKGGQAAVNVARERSEVTGGLANLTLAQLPLVNNTPGDLYYASDGLKPNETPGNGTGCAVFWNGATQSWLRVGDYQSPSVPSGNANANTVLAGPVSGPPAQPAFRALVAADIPVGGGSPLTAKGDLYTFSSTNARLAIGADNSVLVADSTQVTGNKWATTLAGLTLTQPTIGDFTNADHIHQGVSSGGTLNAAAIASGVLANARVNFASPDPIGATTPNTGAFTSLTVNPGALLVKSTSAADVLAQVDGLATHNRRVQWLTNGVARFSLMANSDAESGSNAGSNLDVVGNSDAGTFLGVYLRIFRSSGIVWALNGLQAGGTEQTQFDGNGLAAKYNNDNTAGNGLSSVVGRVALTNQVASIGTTAIFAPPVIGEYLIMIYLQVTTAGTGGTVSAGVSWNDGNGVQSFSTSNLSLTVTGFTQLTPQFIHVITGGSLSYTTTVTAGTGAFKYALYIEMVRLS